MDDIRIGWNNSLLIGNPDIDKQHQRLVEMIQTISEFPTSKDEKVLTETLAYAAMHFTDEETFMHDINYPEVQAHITKHKTLARILMTYSKDYETGKTDLYAFKQFMFRWVREHIMNKDQRIGYYLQSCRSQAVQSKAALYG